MKLIHDRISNWDSGAAEWRDCGVRYIVLVNASVLQRSLRKALASVMPFNKIVRGNQEAVTS